MSTLELVRRKTRAQIQGMYFLGRVGQQQWFEGVYGSEKFILPIQQRAIGKTPQEINSQWSPNMASTIPIATRSSCRIRFCSRNYNSIRALLLVLYQSQNYHVAYDHHQGDCCEEEIEDVGRDQPRGENPPNLKLEDNSKDEIRKVVQKEIREDGEEGKDKLNVDDILGDWRAGSPECWQVDIVSEHYQNIITFVYYSYSYCGCSSLSKAIYIFSSPFRNTRRICSCSLHQLTSLCFDIIRQLSHSQLSTPIIKHCMNAARASLRLSLWFLRADISQLLTNQCPVKA